MSKTKKYFDSPYHHFSSNTKFRAPNSTNASFSNRGAWTSSQINEVSSQKLCKPQFLRFSRLIEQEFLITDKTDSVMVKLSLEQLLKHLSELLVSQNIQVEKDGIRLVGSAATSVISAGVTYDDQEEVINDVDINIYIEQSFSFFQILQIEEECLGHFVKDQTGHNLSPRLVCDNYFKEMIRVNTKEESWSLITIGSQDTNIDIRFIEKTKRSYAFSTDSFSIILNPILTCPNVSSCPQIIYESDYGDITEVLSHLKLKKLKIKKPEEVRRGMFRTCLELSKGRTFESEAEETMVCNTFCQALFEEFPTKEVFEQTLKKFIVKHRSNVSQFLTHLYRYIDSYSSEVEKKTKFCICILELTKEIQPSISN